MRNVKLHTVFYIKFMHKKLLKKSVYLLIQGLAEIGEHFKILVTHFSARVSWHIGFN